MGLSADHLPLHLAAAIGPFGALQGHVARANPLWRDAADSEVLAIFHGPQAYVTPSWYPKPSAPRQGGADLELRRGPCPRPLRVIDDPAWLRGNWKRWSRSHEAGFAEPWQIADAPPDYIDKMLAAIVGIEIVIGELTGKWKDQPEPARGQSRRRGRRAARAGKRRRAGDRGTRRRHRGPMTLQQAELPAPGPDARAASAALSRLIAEEIGAAWGLDLLRPLHGTGAVCAGPGLLRRAARTSSATMRPGATSSPRRS
jgi:transcriptional regulator